MSQKPKLIMGLPAELFRPSIRLEKEVSTSAGSSPKITTLPQENREYCPSIHRLNSGQENESHRNPSPLSRGMPELEFYKDKTFWGYD